MFILFFIFFFFFQFPFSPPHSIIPYLFLVPLYVLNTYSFLTLHLHSYFNVGSFLLISIYYFLLFIPFICFKIFCFFLSCLSVNPPLDSSSPITPLIQPSSSLPPFMAYSSPPLKPINLIQPSLHSSSSSAFLLFLLLHG